MANKNAAIMVRVEPEVKEAVSSKVNSMGLDLSTLLRMFVYKIYNDPSFVVAFGENSANIDFGGFESDEAAMRWLAAARAKT